MAVRTVTREMWPQTKWWRPTFLRYGCKVVVLDRDPSEAVGVEWPVQPSTTLDADERYAEVEARFNGLSPNPRWFEEAEGLAREVQEARLSMKFDEN